MKCKCGEELEFHYPIKHDKSYEITCSCGQLYRSSLNAEFNHPAIYDEATDTWRKYTPC